MLPTPGAIGINWYPAFDPPRLKRDSQGHYWVDEIRPGEQPRGGHCVAVKERRARRQPYGLDPWSFYDQGEEGACVGFGCSQMMSQLNGRLYLARWLWDRSKEIDPWPDTNPGDDNGTSVRTAFAILRDRGHVTWENSDVHKSADDDWQLRKSLQPYLEEGIRAYRWATSVDDIVNVLGYQDVGFVDLMNSWGRGYPSLVRMPLETLHRVIFEEDGEFGVPTDR